MHESSDRLAVLRRRIEDLSGPAIEESGLMAIGHAPLDEKLGGGLARGRLHEIVAPDPGDTASAMGFAAMLAIRFGGSSAWLRVGHRWGDGPHPPGLREIGFDPGPMILVSAPDAPALLRAAGEAVRCGAIGVAVIEIGRETRLLDLTASRRLALAAESSGITPLVLRIDADPGPSAAHTRWAVRSAPSRALAARAPGHPTIDVELLRHRGGMTGLHWRLEWDRDRGSFREAALPGAALPFPPRRTVEGDAGLRRAG